MFKRVLSFLLLAFAAMVLVACGSGNNENDGESADSGETITIQAAHVVAQDTTQHEMYEKFKELVEERSDGQMEIDIYPDGQLGGEREMVENTQAGSIEISSPSVGVLANFSPALEVFDFPFIFEDRDTVYEVLDGEAGETLLAGLEDADLIGLGFSENGWRHISNKNGEIVKPEDVEGLKLRTMEVPMHIGFWKELGANPTPLAFTEVFSGLSSGVVDGQENPLQLTYTSKFHEPSKYITTTGHIFDPEPVVVNKDFFEELSEENQEIIQTSLDESIDYLRDLNRDLDDELREKLEDDGAIITDLSDEEHEAWIDAVVPFYEEHADEVDTDMLKQLLEAAGNDKLLDAIK